MLNFDTIIDYIILQGSNIRNIGLYHGKIGIVLSLFLYARVYNDKIVENYAWDLLQDVYDGANKMMPVGLEDGLSGIGYGITLLRSVGIFESNMNDVLYDIDQKIMNIDPRRITDYTVRSGMQGIMSYICIRQSLDEELHSIDNQYISELKERLSWRYNVMEFSLTKNIIRPNWKVGDYVGKDLGIDNGCCYYIIHDVYDKVFYNK